MSLLIKGRRCTRIHFVGIFGSGMSAIAQYLKWNSIHVTGSDRSLNSASTDSIQKKLISIGCAIFPQDGSGITDETSVIVLSSAIEDSNPDYQQAKKRNIPVFHRSEVLASIVETKKTIAVAGTNGKSTVTGLIYYLLSVGDQKPSLISGGNLHTLVEEGLIGNAYYTDSEYLVIEADESDGTLVKYKPYISIFLNLSKDHKPVSETFQLFQTLSDQSEHVFVNYHTEKLRLISRAKTFGLVKQADFHPDTFEQTNSSSIIWKNNLQYLLPFPGKHMLDNLNAALAVCFFLHGDEYKLSKGIISYKGLQRRYDRIETTKGILIIDDYAHNPDKIYATLSTTQKISKKVFILFQPHGFGPTKFMFHELVHVFQQLVRKSDDLYILPIYYAGGTISSDIASSDIAHELKGSRGTIHIPENRNDVVKDIVKKARKGDIILSMGARDPSLPSFARDIANAIEL